jgi:hypothetical protein
MNRLVLTLSLLASACAHELDANTLELECRQAHTDCRAMVDRLCSLDDCNRDVGMVQCALDYDLCTPFPRETSVSYPDGSWMDADGWHRVPIILCEVR